MEVLATPRASPPPLSPPGLCRGVGLPLCHTPIAFGPCAALAKQYQSIVASQGEIHAKEGGIVHFTYNADGKVVVVYCRAEYVIECRAEGQRVTHHNQVRWMGGWDPAFVEWAGGGGGGTLC